MGSLTEKGDCMFGKDMKAETLLHAIQSGNAPFLVDIRDSASYAQGHIPGALSNPAQSFDLGMFADLPKETEIVVSCYRGVMSKDAARYLASAGFTNVISLKGGMKGWMKLKNAPLEH